MSNTFLTYFLLVLMMASCTAASKTFDKKEYRRSKVIATYAGMANELQDGYLVLKENGYFKFYQKIWLIITIKEGGYVGRYTQSNNTLYLNWLGTDPKSIKYYLSDTCEIDPATKGLWFIDKLSGKRLWGMSQVPKK